MLPATNHAPPAPSPGRPHRGRLSGLLTPALAAGASLALGMSLLLAPPAAAAPDTLTEADLGVTAQSADLGPVATEVNVRSTATGTLPDGTHMLYAISNGEPATFNAINADTGELVGSFDLAPKTLGAYPAVASDGTAYFAARDGRGAQVHRYDPASNQVELLFENPVGESVVRGFEIDEEAGVLYGNTYPNAKVFAYDLETEEIRDYGSVTDDDIYAWGFARVGDHLYSGTGMSVGHVMRIDADSGDIEEIPLPPEYDEVLTYFYWAQEIGDVVAFAFSPGVPDGTNVAFWDTTEEEWVCEGAVPTFLSLNGPITEPGHDGRVYYKSEGEIWAFNISDCSVTPTGWEDTGLEDSGSHRTLDTVVEGEGETAHTLLIGTNNDGSFWRFDPASGEAELFDSGVEGSPLEAHSVHVGPDGKVYTGTYLGPGVLGVYDPATGEAGTVAGPGQVDTWGNHGDEMLLGSYPNAVVSTVDTTQEWDLGTNPADGTRVGDRQDRIMAFASDGDRLAVGTVSDYGVSGGALSVSGPDGQLDVHRDLIPKQSVVALDFGDDGLIYGGTSQRGGLSSENSSEDAHLFVFDPASAELVHQEIPVAGEAVIGDVLVTGGTTWGLTTGGDLFAFDNASREITATAQLDAPPSGSPWGMGSMLAENPVDGLIYGVSGGALFTLDPENGQFQLVLDGGFSRLDISQTGDIYVTDATNLHRIAVNGAAACDTTVDEDVDGPLGIVDGVTCLEGVSVEGPISVADGAGLVITDSQLHGPVDAHRASQVRIADSSIDGPFTATGTTGSLELRNTTVSGPVTVRDGVYDTGSFVISGTTINGPLQCSGNRLDPVDDGTSNAVTGPASGQCARIAG